MDSHEAKETARDHHDVEAKTEDVESSTRASDGRRPELNGEQDNLEDEGAASTPASDDFLKVNTKITIEDGDDDTPGSAFSDDSSSSSDYSNRDDDERPLGQRYGEQEGEEDGGDELDDFGASYLEAIGQHPNSAAASSGQTSQRPRTPPGRDNTAPQDDSPRTKRRLDDEARRGYPYHARPTRKVVSEDDDEDFWLDRYNRVVSRNRRTRRDDSTGMPVRGKRRRSPLSPIRESPPNVSIPDDQIERPSTPEPPQSSQGRRGYEFVRSSPPVEEESIFDGLVALSQNSKSADWADEEDNADWEADLELVLSRSNSISDPDTSRRSSIAEEPLPKVSIVNDAETTNPQNEGSESQTSDKSPIENEDPQSDTPVFVKMPVVAEKSEPPLARLQGVKPQPLVATTESSLTKSVEPDASPVSPDSPDSISPQSAVSIEVLEQVTGMNDESARQALEEIHEQITEMHSRVPRTKEEAAAVLRMQRALITYRQEELENDGRLKRKRRIRVPNDEEEFLKLFGAKAWEYRRQRNELEVELDDVQEDLFKAQREFEALTHRLKVAEEELKWAKTDCPSCGGPMPGSSKIELVGNKESSHCTRCKVLEKELADLQAQQAQVGDRLEKMMQEMDETDSKNDKLREQVRALKKKLAEITNASSRYVDAQSQTDDVGVDLEEQAVLSTKNEKTSAESISQLEAQAQTIAGLRAENEAKVQQLSRQSQNTAKLHTKHILEAQGLSNEVHRQERDITILEYRLEEADKVEKRLRGMLGMVMNDVSSPLTPHEEPEETEVTLPMQMEVPMPRSIADRTPVEPRDTTPSPVSAGLPPTPGPPVKTSVEIPFFGSSPEPPKSAWISEPGRFRYPGWQTREEAWRNTEAYRTVMAWFEKREIESRATEESYEEMQTAAFYTLVGGFEPMERSERYAVYAHIERADYFGADAVPRERQFEYHHNKDGTVTRTPSPWSPGASSMRRESIAESF